QPKDKGETVKKLRPIVAIMLLALAYGAPAAPAKGAIGGEITLKVSEPDFSGGNQCCGLAEVSGKLQTKKICADFRRFRIKLLDAPSDYIQHGALYGNRDKTHGDAAPLRGAPAPYSSKARAKKTRVARGLKRAKGAEIESPGVSITVTQDMLNPY